MSRVDQLANDVAPVANDPSVFYGDPMVIDTDLAGFAAGDPSKTGVAVSSAAAKGALSKAGVQRAASFKSMPSAEKAVHTKIMPLVLTNGKIILDPVKSPIPAVNLNFNLQESLLRYPYAGVVVPGETVAGANAMKCSADADTLASGYAAVPFIKFTIAASQLNAKAGQQYNLYFNGTTATKTGVTNVMAKYTIQRIAANEPITGILIPYIILSNRTIPMLPIFGGGAAGVDDTVTFELVLENTDSSESMTMTIPGYTTKELEEISRLFQLPAGIVL